MGSNGMSLMGSAGPAPAAPPVPSPNTPPAGMGSPATPQPVFNHIENQTQNPTPPAPELHPAVAQAAIKGHAFSSLMRGMMGSHPDPANPNGPPIQNSARQLFSSILAGAIMGAGAGAEAKMGGGVGSFAVGAKAGLQEQQAAQQKAQQAAQQQFENQQKASAAASEEKLRQAQIAMYNVSKLKDMQELQGSSYTLHKKYVDDAKPIVDSYTATGLKPIREGVSETDHDEWLKAHPGDSTLDWQPVGLVHYVDQDGNINYQTVWNAYRPTTDKVTVTPSVFSDWKSSGLLDREPDLMANLKPDESGNRSMPYAAFIKFAAESTQLKKEAQEKLDQDYNTKHEKAELEHLAAQTQQEKSTAAASGSEAAIRTFELKQKTAAVEAQKALTKNGEDWSKLTPEQKVAMQPQVQKDIEGYRTELNDPLLKQQLSSNDSDIVRAAQERASSLQEQLDAARGHSIFVSALGPKTDPIQATVDKLRGKTPQEVAAALNDPKNGVPVAARPEIYKRLGIASPPSPDTGIRYTPEGKVVPDLGTIGPLARTVGSMPPPTGVSGAPLPQL